jgi:nicotinamidase/pyrazinamidase
MRDRAQRAKRVKRVVFFDIDTQFDFMDPAGRLYVKGAQKIVPNLKRITALADRLRVPVISSLDRHVLHDPEFQIFPVHCVRNTPGAAKIPETLADTTKQVMIAKRTFDVFSNPRTRAELAKFTDVYVYGVALDYCVKAACQGARRLGLRVYLIKDATRAVAPRSGKAAAGLLRRNGVCFVMTRGLQRRISL